MANKIIHNLYLNVKTFENALCLNIAFLKGIISETAYHGPLDDETIPLLSNLVKINENGFLTINSQPGEISEPYISPLDNMRYITEQKSSIEGFIHKSNLQPLIKFIENKPYYIKIDDTNGIIYNSFPVKNII